MSNITNILKEIPKLPAPSRRELDRNYRHSIMIMRSKTFDEQVAWIEGLLRQGRPYVGGEDAVAMIYMLSGDLQNGSDQQFMIDLLMDFNRNLS